MNTTVNSHRRTPDGDIVPFTGLAVSWQTNTENYRVRPNAVVRTLRESELDRKRRGGQMLWPILSEHLSALAFGWTASAQITDEGLYVTGYLDTVTPECQKAFQDAKSGKVNGLSLGFVINAEHLENGVRVLDEIEIVEISAGSDPVDTKARFIIGDFSDYERSVMRAISQEREYKMKDNHQWVDDGDDVYERPLYDHSPRQEPDDKGYRIEYGHEDESREVLERAWRAQLREEDADLYTLTPGGKAFQKEVERRQQERVAKQKAQQEALDAERKERAERQAAMAAETFTAESFAQAANLDVVFTRKWFKRIAGSDGVVPVDAKELVLRAQDVRNAAKRDHEMIEMEAIRARNKRAEGGR